MTLRSRPFPVVLAGPSGAGKTTLARAMVERGRDLLFALSATTRSPRPGEVNERDYRFVDAAGFDELLARGELLEWAWVHGQRYGTLREGVTRALAEGRTVVLDIDVQGARRVRERYPDALLIFVLPPDGEELERRLKGRGSEDAGQRVVRLRTALDELGAVSEFDYVVVNDDFEGTLRALESICQAEGRRRARADGLEAHVLELERVLRKLLEIST